jgi:16S rRNA (guanine527-N7)-methyltransferase
VVSRETPGLPTAWEPARSGLQAYADLLATTGVERGLIGPREAPRLWERHLLNCAALAELVPNDATVLDVGSGAGLPGIPLALVRPDLSVTLLEPLLRRSTFLEEAVEVLSLEDRVTVVRGRAEDHEGRYAVVTARAVAPMTRLVGWCLPRVRPGGVLLAMKGAGAPEEIAEAGLTTAEVVTCGAGIVDPPATVVRIEVPTTAKPAPARGGSR